MHDDDLFLRHALERLAGYPPDEDEAYTHVRYEARAVRRRRAAVGSVLGAGAVAIGIATLTVRPSANVEEVGASRVTTTTAVEITSTLPSPTTSTVLVTSVPASVAPDSPSIIPPIAAQEPLVTTPPTTQPPATEPPPPPPTEPAPATTKKPPRTTAPKPTRTTVAAPTPTPSPTAPPPPPAPTSATTTSTTTTTTAPDGSDAPRSESVTKSKEVTGGRLVVEWNGRKLKVIEAAPAQGYSATIDKASGSNVSVTFTGATIEYRLRATWNGERIVFEVQKDDIAPATTTVVPPEGAEAEGGRTRVVVRQNGSGVAGSSRNVSSGSV